MKIKSLLIKKENSSYVVLAFAVFFLLFKLLSHRSPDPWIWGLYSLPYFIFIVFALGLIFYVGVLFFIYKSRAFVIIFANLVVLVGIGIFVEIGGQIYAHFNPSYESIPLKPDPILGWTFIPNTEHIVSGGYWYAREFSSQVKINSHGFRDKERNIEKEKNTIRIALIGDSMVAAREVNFEMTAGQVLEKKLNDELSPKTGKKYEVLNFGVPGYGLDQIMINWKVNVSKYKPDFTFIYVFEKNYLRTISRTWCARGTLGIDKFKNDSSNCLHVRPFVILRKENVGKIDILKYRQKEGFNATTRSLDFLYIDPNNLKQIKGLLSLNNKEKVLLFLEKLPLQVFPPYSYQKFVEEQVKYLKKEMGGKRMVRKAKRLFVFSSLLSLKKQIIHFSEVEKEKDWWRKEAKYTTGNANDFPSWITTNFVNLKALNVLGNRIKENKSRVVIVDSFLFHNEVIPPLEFASNGLKNVSEFYSYGYIPLYEKLLESKENGISPRWKYDGHLNPLGNKIFAESMFDYLVPLLN